MLYDETQAINKCEEEPSLIFSLIDEDHKELVDALQDYIYWKCISRRRTPNGNEKMIAERTWLASRHRAVMTRANIDLQSIMKLSRKKSMIP